MRVDDLALVQGMTDTRATLAEWNREPWRVVVRWVAWSLLVAVALLVAVYVIAKASTPDLPRLHVPGVHGKATPADVGHVLFRNSLVLALHAMACVAGFIAGSSLPISAARHRGLWRWVHEKAGPLAIAFVVGATLFSLTTQAYALGLRAADLSAELGLSPFVLLIGLLPHALPELTALFLPLAAWTLAEEAGLEIGEIDREPSDEIEQGNVISTGPAEGEMVSEGDVVDLIVSSGEEEVAVPRLVGQTRAEATGTLAEVGLQLGSVSQEPSSQPEGTVLRSDPAEGVSVPAGSQVDIVLSSGPTPAPTPSPTPQPTPTPTPTPSPTPTPTPDS